MTTAKDEVLARIRHAMHGSPPARELEYAALPRQYQRSGSLGAAARLSLFVERLEDYEAAVYRCPEARIRETIAEALTVRRKRGLIVPKALPPEWLPGSFAFVRDDELTYEEIDRSEGVLTGSAVAIALTGTIVLRHSFSEGRRALTLIPDYHLCVVYAARIVETVAEGIREMDKFKTAPITTISGPSATSDIEMTRIKGVHGPRTLDVILVGERKTE